MLPPRASQFQRKSVTEKVAGKQWSQLERAIHWKPFPLFKKHLSICIFNNIQHFAPLAQNTPILNSNQESRIPSGSLLPRRKAFEASANSYLTIQNTLILRTRSRASSQTTASNSEKNHEITI